MATQCTRSWCVRPVMGLEFQPGQLAGGMIEGLVVGDGASAVRIVPISRRGPFAPGTADPLQRQVDAALDRHGTAGNHGPVGLVDIAATE